MAWVLLLVQLPCFLAASVQLRRTKLTSETPHSAEWFRSLGTDAVDEVIPPQPARLRLTTLSSAKEEPTVRNVLKQVKLEPPSHLRPGRPGLKILQNSSDGAANATNAGNAGNATDNASVPPPVLELRQVKGNLTCAQPGCAADVLLQVYDPQKEYVRDCNLSLSVHATDFDDNFDGERVMNFMGNSRALGHDCYPEVNGCVSNQSRELLFSCIRDRPVSTILTDEGNMLVSAQIAHNVDECPFNGNLLHGVTTIACYVGNLSDLTTTSIGETTTTTSTHWVTAENFEKYPEFVRKWLVEHPGMSLPDMPGYESILNMSRVMPVDPVAIGALPFRRNLSAYGAYGSYGPGGLGYGGAYGEENLGAGPGGRGGLRLEGSDGSFNLSTTGFLRCAEKGCKTNMLLDFNRTLVSINKCTMQLWVNQTDFDNKDGAVEFLTIKVAGNAVLDKAKPGKNPCRSAYHGHRLNLEEIQMHALQDFDITEAVQLGPVDIAGEISKQVDECPSNGYLLDASIQVACNVSSIASLLEHDRVSVADVLTLNKALSEANLAQQDETFKEFLAVAKVNTSSNASSNATGNATSNATGNATKVQNVKK